MSEKYKVGDRVWLNLTHEVRKELVIKGRDNISGEWLCEDGYGNEWHVDEDELTPLTPQGRPDPPGETGTKGPDGENQRSRLAEVLGVEEDEIWRYPGYFGLYRVHNGAREYWDEDAGWLSFGCEKDLVKMMAHPELIIRLPHFTEPEVAVMRTDGGAV